MTKLSVIVLLCVLFLGVLAEDNAENIETAQKTNQDSDIKNLSSEDKSKQEEDGNTTERDVETIEKVVHEDHQDSETENISPSGSGSGSESAAMQNAEVETVQTQNAPVKPPGPIGRSMGGATRGRIVDQNNWDRNESTTQEGVTNSNHTNSTEVDTTTQSIDSTTIGNTNIASFTQKSDLTPDSLTSEFAPPEDTLNQKSDPPYIISETRLQEIRSRFMYWFWDKGGNNENNGDYQTNINPSAPTIHKNLNFQLPFFGFRYNYTRVSLNGYLEFSDPPEIYDKYPLVFPVKDWPKKNDPAFIGIFFSKCRIGGLRPEDVDQKRAGVYFRLERDLQGRTDKFGVEVRERLKWDIRDAVIGSDSFEPKHAIIVTWKNVTFAGGITIYRTNTFQMVLATDEVFTYAMFNYAKMDWTSHTESRGDTTTGEGGIPAYIGFNAGNGTRSYSYDPYSQSSVIRDVLQRGFANGFPGRHVFRIDENILLATCNKDIDGANLPLVFAPESGNMLGGTIVNVTGPCFLPTDKVSCKFDTEIIEGVVVDSNRVICVQPRLMVEGYVYLEIAISPANYKWRGQYFVEPPASATEKIFFLDDGIYQTNPAQIKMTWVHKNLTTNENAPVRISLWGYRERTTTPEFFYIDSISDSSTNIGEFTISPAQFRKKLYEYELKHDLLPLFGFIQINLTDSIPIKNNQDVKITPVIWSRPIPLAWYFSQQWQDKYGKNWADKLCDNWIRKDRYLKNFAHELPQCPCTIAQALTDKGRYIPDYDCDKDSNPKCMYHHGSRHCVRSGAPNLDGSEQHCCYDKNGYLMLTYDQVYGSSPHRSHSLGILPWDEANKVPTLSYWYNDVAPLYACCIWQSDSAIGCETFRFERRPTQDCVAYQAPGVAGVFGDPHIITFDDLEYTFNGKGEFTLIRSTAKNVRLDVQGRFEQLPMNAYGEVRATQLTAIAARGNSSSVIEVRLRPKEARWRYRLDVLFNGKRVYFDRPSLKFQHFPGVLVYTPTYILNQSEVIIMFDSGAGVEVLENQGYMSARAYLPWTYINQTRGLFGNWSFDVLDDFTIPDGQKVGISTNLNDFERIYNDFGMKWILEDKDDNEKGRSLFYREFGRTSSYYNNRTFKPEFKMTPSEIIPPNRTQDIEKAEEFCHEYYQCKYDYAMSLDRDLAHFSLNYHSTIRNLKETNNKPVITCGVLETPRFGRKSNFLFIPGTKVTFECNENFILVGDNRRECLPDGRWNTPEFGYTQCLRQQEYSARTAGVTSGIVLLVIIPLILLIVFCVYKFVFKKRKYEEDDEYNDSYYGQRMEDRRKQAEELAAAKMRAHLESDYDDEDVSSSKRETDIM